MKGNKVDKVEKMKKTRVSVTMTQPYVEILDRLVEKGVYLTRSEAVLEALRLLFIEHGIESFSEKEPFSPEVE